MSTANETITKLSEALNTLIVAYEDLQKENEKLNTQIKDLTLEKEQVTEEKEILANEKEQALQELNDLQKDVNVLSDNSEQQNSSMYTMLDKIESLLGNDAPVKKEETLPDDEYIANHVDEVFSDKQELEVEQQTNTPVLEEAEKTVAAEQQDSNKIDLNRMASLLNGFNK